MKLRVKYKQCFYAPVVMISGASAGVVTLLLSLTLFKDGATSTAAAKVSLNGTLFLVVVEVAVIVVVKFFLGVVQTILPAAVSGPASS